MRYLPAGVASGSKAAYLTVGTYFVQNASAVTKVASKRPGVTFVAVTGSVAYVGATRPQSVFFAADGSSYQVELFDPTAGEAKALVASGKLVPIG